MATVYKVFDTRLERNVAIKLIRKDAFPPAQLGQILQRFYREAKALARLSHPNIIKIHDFGEFEGAPYFVMEYLAGGTLKERMGKPFPWQEATRLLIPVAHALSRAHQQGILHRDVKPSNIMLTATGDPILTDFGIAKMLESEETRGLTLSGVGIGTPEYMAPEQGKGEKVDARADIYSLGIVFFELVTGCKPYTAITPMAIILKHINDPLPLPGQFVPALPVNVEHVILKALAKDPENRYPDMGAFAAALENLLVNPGEITISREDTGKTLIAGTPSQDIVTPVVPLTKPKRWWRWAVGIGGLVLVAGIIIALKILNKKDEDTKALQPAAIAISINTPVPITSFTATLTDTPQLTSTPIQPEPETVSPVDNMKLVFIPEGNSLIGVTQADLDVLFAMCPTCERKQYTDAPQHSVYLDSFRIDQTEVTMNQFSLFIKATKYITDAEKYGLGRVFDPSINDFHRLNSVNWQQPQGKQISLAQFGNYPVVQVSWNDASAYCSWAGRRLPSEAEWEKAARGMEGFLFPWGNEQPNSQLVNYNQTNGGPLPVGSYPEGVSPYGAMDMAGNVYEWVNDRYSADYYNVMPNKNPSGPTSGEERVYKGGSWAALEKGGHMIIRGSDWVIKGELTYLSSSFRMSGVTLYSNDLLGFRCASSAQ
jgi:eukaryotic-like serine/threonine-protein kinase